LTITHIDLQKFDAFAMVNKEGFFMKIVLQRVSGASVSVCRWDHPTEGTEVSRIKNGFLALVGLGVDDDEEIFDKMIKKIINPRVFPVDNSYEILLVSQFTLYADCRKGNRPLFIDAMRPEKANKIYVMFVKRFKELYVPEKVKDGLFGASMKVSLTNDGPVTILL
jgi:D-tyrosyl-tRNA(Tyr) deacylase